MSIAYTPSSERFQAPACLLALTLSTVLLLSLLPPAVQLAPRVVQQAPPLVVTPREAQPPVVPQADTFSPERIEPFVRHLDQGEGSRIALISPTPLQYQASDGSWQPIDARFTHKADGFTSTRNLLQVRSGERQAMLQFTHADATLHWTPQALAVVHAGSPTQLATPFPAGAPAPGRVSGDGRTLTYAGNWTLPALSDEAVGASHPKQHCVLE